MQHKRLLSISVLAGVLAATTLAAAQQPDPVIDPLDKRLTAFFETLKSKNIQAAYELLGARQLGTPDDRKKLEDETAKIETLYGACRGTERVYTKQVGADLVFLKYLYKCSKYPVLWHVTFYRSTTGSELGPESRTWQVVSIRFDTDLEVLTLLKE
ncbi:MAG: hypothetical protein ACYC6Y_06805 [Thermoguttaceae bacterium]